MNGVIDRSHVRQSAAIQALIHAAACEEFSEADEAASRHRDPLIAAVDLAWQVLGGESVGVASMYYDAAVAVGLSHNDGSRVMRMARQRRENSRLIAQAQGRVVTEAALDVLCQADAKARLHAYQASGDAEVLRGWLGLWSEEEVGHE
jgi:hypothetical protein